MNLLHDLLLKDLYFDWVKLKKDKPTTNFMNFGPVMESLK